MPPKKKAAPAGLTEAQLRAYAESVVKSTEGGTMAEAARLLDVDNAMLHRFIKGGEKPFPKVVRALGYEARTTTIYVPLASSEKA